jgi:arylsulfatase
VVSKEYQDKFAFRGGGIVRVVYDIGDDAYVDVEKRFAVRLARD